MKKIILLSAALVLIGLLFSSFIATNSSAEKSSDAPQIILSPKIQSPVRVSTDVTVACLEPEKTFSERLMDFAAIDENEFVPPNTAYQIEDEAIALGGDALPELRRAIQEARSPLAKGMLCNALAAIDTPEAVETLISLIENESDSTAKADMLPALENFGSMEVVNFLAENPALSDQPEIAAPLIDVVANLADAHSVKTLLKTGRGASGYAAEAIEVILQSLNDESAVETLLDSYFENGDGVAGIALGLER